jgi:hypothetical protein
MKIRSSLPLILLFCTAAYSVFDNSKFILTMKNFNEMQSVLRDLDHLIGIFFYNSYECKRCEHAEREIDKLAEDLQGIVPIFHMECERAWEMQNKTIPFQLCDPKFNSDLPIFLFFEPPKNRYNTTINQPNPVNEHLYLGTVGFKEMREFVKDKIPVFSRNLTNETDYESFITFKLLPTKVILFTDKQESPILFKGITSFYRERIDVSALQRFLSNNFLLL